MGRQCGDDNVLAGLVGRNFAPPLDGDDMDAVMREQKQIDAARIQSAAVPIPACRVFLHLARNVTLRHRDNMRLLYIFIRQYDISFLHLCL